MLHTGNSWNSGARYWNMCNNIYEAYYHCYCWTFNSVLPLHQIGGLSRVFLWPYGSWDRLHPPRTLIQISCQTCNSRQFISPNKGVLSVDHHHRETSPNTAFQWTQEETRWKQLQLTWIKGTLNKVLSKAATEQKQKDLSVCKIIAYPL